MRAAGRPKGPYRAYPLERLGESRYEASLVVEMLLEGEGDRDNWLRIDTRDRDTGDVIMSAEYK